jgi:hypothetical protein
MSTDDGSVPPPPPPLSAEYAELAAREPPATSIKWSVVPLPDRLAAGRRESHSLAPSMVGTTMKEGSKVELPQSLLSWIMSYLDGIEILRHCYRVNYQWLLAATLPTSLTSWNDEVKDGLHAAEIYQKNDIMDIKRRSTIYNVPGVCPRWFGNGQCSDGRDIVLAGMTFYIGSHVRSLHLFKWRQCIAPRCELDLSNATHVSTLIAYHPPLLCGFIVLVTQTE